LAGVSTEKIGSHLKSILLTFDDRDPARITVADVQKWVFGLSARHLRYRNKQRKHDPPRAS
jgi:hypothetical protein